MEETNLQPCLHNFVS